MKILKTLILLSPLVFCGSYTAVVFAQPTSPYNNGRAASAQQTRTVSMPTIRPNNGSGPAFVSDASQWPGYTKDHFDYETNEYLISGTAAGAPYTTRLVIRKPADDSRFSGLVITEAMHPVGKAHGFQYNSVYLMNSGHIEVEVTTRGFEQIKTFNPSRYSALQLNDDQISEILAQAGALIKSSRSPLAGLGLRKEILWGTSATSRILTDYLPTHQALKMPDGSNIFDGFMPTSNGSQIDPVDVPMIQIPTQHEFQDIATAQQDGDAPGEQFRVYEFPGMGHLMAKHNERITPDVCIHPKSNYPLVAYMSVGLHHLLQWVDRGILPPRADRVLIDRNVDNDGSLMALDEHGNPLGGIRSPYVDVPTRTYHAVNEPAPDGGPAANTLCRLSVWDDAFSRAELRALYGSRQNFLRQFEASLNRQEAQGWSLPVYHDLLMEDARSIAF